MCVITNYKQDQAVSVTQHHEQEKVSRVALRVQEYLCRTLATCISELACSDFVANIVDERLGATSCGSDVRRHTSLVTSICTDQLWRDGRPW
jgi:hypothetical protein